MAVTEGGALKHDGGAVGVPSERVSRSCVETEEEARGGEDGDHTEEPPPGLIATEQHPYARARD